MKENHSAARQRAERLFASASAGASAPAHAAAAGGSPLYLARIAAVEAKNERLRELRLARDAAEPRQPDDTPKPKP